ncbi:hypothetical protein EYB45_03705 [Erythrobacteraceae bacterium CFH 75059]|uniref:NepR family anti-sigma factor n=1 Tax=Qipengyuania thermophila TaxID=2509361 RepID=UPI00101F8353|nr:NepR family anti-sigma factor [Qipengyuania thermophila]TCD06795.1 hypothetical protein EYB45_03705 [Erythrobacteraceae bacterium CFH 75059]
MTHTENTGTRGAASFAPRRPGAGSKPGWSNGLRKLYDSVVEEPLPDTFKDLLAQLDKRD